MARNTMYEGWSETPEEVAAIGKLRKLGVVVDVGVNPIVLWEQIHTEQEEKRLQELRSWGVKVDD